MYKNVVLKLARNTLVAAVSLFSSSALHAATLAWNASSSPNITAYTVRYGTTSGNYPSVINAGIALTATLPNLISGTRYYFVVTAQDSSGVESDPSNELSYTPSGNPLPNLLPTLDLIADRTISEDAGQQVVSLTGISAGLGDLLQVLSVTASSSNPGLIPNPTVTYTSPNPTGTLLFAPAANVTGTATITVTVNDGGLLNNLLSRTFTVTVNPVNDTPTLNAINNLALNVNAVQQIVSLGGIGAGAANENQTLTVAATSSNPALIPAPGVTYSSPNSTGTLRFTPVAGATGTATITVTVNDGQSQNNIVNRSFTVTVSNTANTPPTLNVPANVTINEDAAPQTINLSGITPGAAGETQALTVTATSSNPGLIPNPAVSYTSPASTGTLSFTPAANANGMATITVTVNDGQNQNNTISRSFVVTVNPVNDAPTLNGLSNLTLATSAGQQTVSLSGIGAGANESQTLAVTATSSNPALIPAPSVTYSSPNSTGTLLFTPVAGATGTAAITVTVNDGQSQNNIVNRSFTVTVSGSSTQTIYVEAETGARVSPMTVGLDANAANGQYVYSTGNNRGTVSFPIIISQTGTYVVWCRVLSPDAGRDSFFVSMDGGTEEVFSTAPGGWSSAWQWIRINLSGPIRTYSLSQGSHTLVFRCRESSTSLDALYITSNPSFVPPGSGAGNAPPTLDPLGNLTLFPNSGQRTISLSGISSGAANENQTLTITATSSKPALIPNPTVTYTSPGSTGTLRFTPALNVTGAATITVTVNDGQSQNNTISRSFAVTVSSPVSLFIQLEAESGTRVAPMTVASDAEATGGRYIYSSIDNQGTMSIPINIPVAGTYSIWCRVLSPDNGRDSFFVAADGGTEEIFITAPNTWSSSWQWTKLNGHLTGGERIFVWYPGTHTLVFRGREKFTFLDALYITNDRNLIPQTGLKSSQAPIDFSAANLGEDLTLIDP
jgi:Fibronectin type III domain/Bacterial Ig domain